VILVTLASVSILLLSSLLAARITRRLRDSERSVRISQERLDAMVSSAMDAIVAVDPSLRMSLFNRAAERIFRMDASRALGRPVSILLPERARGDSALRLERLSEPGAAPFAIGRADGLVGLRSDGVEFPMEAAVSRTEVEGEVLYTLILRDITAQVEAERALAESESRMRQSQKLEAIGQLAGGIAHDFNNLLTAINGYSELSLAMLEAEHPLRENLVEIRKAGERAANLTRQLLAYSRKQMVIPRVLNLNQVVGNIGRMLRRLIGERYALVTGLEPDLELVRVDAGQVEQVLVNLVLNARDAMPDGGRIEIRTRNDFLDPGRENMMLEAEPGQYAVLEVADEGVGMSPEIRERIFEPFFTTKSVGKGTGLGLPSVYGIVRQAGGALQVETAPGRGALFRIFLPAVTSGERSLEEAQGPPQVGVRGSGETILLAEDEAAVRHFTSAVLEAAGYRVVQAADSHEALSRFPGIREDVRLLVTDIVMPGGDGRELAAKLRDSNPGLPVLFMSGYTDAAINAAELQERGDGFLGKPFSPGQLVRSVREVLRRAELARS
jgi:PAS domain S-box-containing protein